MDNLSLREIMISEEIQSRLSPLIDEYLDEKPALIDALEWTLQLINNDYQNEYYFHARNYEKCNKKSEANIIVENPFFKNSLESLKIEKEE